MNLLNAGSADTTAHFPNKLHENIRPYLLNPKTEHYKTEHFKTEYFKTEYFKTEHLETEHCKTEFIIHASFDFSCVEDGFDDIRR